MNSNSKQRTAGSQPNVRSACEPCHERKVRCIVSTEGGPCDNCQSRKLSCFFLPRYRSGRRPIGNHYLETDRSSTPSANQNSDDSHLSSPQVKRARHKPLQVNTRDQNELFDWNWTSTTRHFPGRSHSSTFSDLNMTLSESDTANDLSLQNSVVDRDYPDMANGGYQNMQPGELSTFLAIDVPSSAEPAASQPPSDHIGMTDKNLGEKDFSMLLECCRKLQSHIARTTDVVSYPPSGESTTTTALVSTVSIMQLQEMLGDVDTSCNFIFGVYGQGFLSKPAAHLRVDLDHASASLTNALILKVFQVCDAVFSCNLLKNHGLDDMLLHKRLDFNITQARIVMSRIQELTQGGLLVSRNIAMNASHVEEKFKSIT